MSDYVFVSSDRDNPICAECDHATGILWMTTLGGHLEFRPVKEERRRSVAPARKPKTRVYVSDLPLTNTPAAVPQADRGFPTVTAGGETVGTSCSLDSLASSPLPERLTLNQQRALRNGAQFGFSLAVSRMRELDLIAAKARLRRTRAGCEGRNPEPRSR